MFMQIGITLLVIISVGAVVFWYVWKEIKDRELKQSLVQAAIRGLPIIQAAKAKADKLQKERAL